VRVTLHDRSARLKIFNCTLPEKLFSICMPCLSLQAPVAGRAAMARRGSRGGLKVYGMDIKAMWEWLAANASQPTTPTNEQRSAAVKTWTVMLQKSMSSSS
jgi:hypothetical protein